MSEVATRVRAKFDEVLRGITDKSTCATVSRVARSAIDEIERLENSLEDCTVRCSGLEDEAEGTRGKIADAVNQFCDEVERPVGSMTYIVPANDRVNRAIIGLHDAIGRNI